MTAILNRTITIFNRTTAIINRMITILNCMTEYFNRKAEIINRMTAILNRTTAIINRGAANCTRWGQHIIILQYITLFLLFIFAGCTHDDEIRILFTGDILLSRNVREEYQRKNESPWTNLKPLFQQADLVAGNLEGAVSDTIHYASNSNSNPENATPLTFDIKRNDISMLREAGFNLITIANNHSCDLGAQSIKRTSDELVANGIRPVGFDQSPQFFTIKDVVISVVAINVIPGKNIKTTPIPSVELMQKLRLARTLSNMVIVSIHWGSELLEWPDKKQRATAGWLIENGADVIIGSHPHVVQPPEIIKGKPVFFSLGNHLFDQKYPATKEGLIADIRIKRGKIYCKGVITRTVSHSFYPETVAEVDYGFSPAKTNRLFRIGAYTFRPISLTGHQKYNLQLQAFFNDKKAWTTLPMSVVSLNAATFDGEQESLFVLEKHYSNMDGETDVRPYVYGIGDQGIYARWRGSALSWPLIDAQISPGDHQTLCALHRGDSFININKTAGNLRVMAYEWNGFGFNGATDSAKYDVCKKLYKDYLPESIVSFGYPR